MCVIEHHIKVHIATIAKARMHEGGGRFYERRCKDEVCAFEVWTTRDDNETGRVWRYKVVHALPATEPRS